MTDRPPPPPGGGHRLATTTPGGYPPPPSTVLSTPYRQAVPRPRRRELVTRRHRSRTAIRHAVPASRRAGGLPPSRVIRRRPPPGPALPKEAYTPWLTRVIAWLIDFMPVLILEGIGTGCCSAPRETACVTDGVEYDLGEFCTTATSTLGQASFIITWLLSIAYIVWNYGYRQGTTGLEHRQVDDEVQGRQRKDRAANRFRHVHRASAGPHHRLADLLHRLAVPAVGRQEADHRR